MQDVIGWNDHCRRATFDRCYVRKGGSSCGRLWCCSCHVFVCVTCFSSYTRLYPRIHRYPPLSASCLPLPLSPIHKKHTRTNPPFIVPFSPPLPLFRPDYIFVVPSIVVTCGGVVLHVVVCGVVLVVSCVVVLVVCLCDLFLFLPMLDCSG